MLLIIIKSSWLLRLWWLKPSEPPWFLEKSPWTLAWRSSLKNVSTLGNWRNIPAANAWKKHGKSMGNPWKAVENHDDMDMSLSELGTNPAVVNHIWGTSTFQQPKWRAILCNVLTQFPRNKMSLNHSKRPTIYAKMKRPKMDTEWYRTNWTNR